MTGETAITEVYPGTTASVWIQNEAAYGTLATSTTWTKTLGLLTPECSMSMKNNLVRSFGLGSRLAQQDVATKFEVSGSISGSFQIGRFLAYGIGTDVRTTVDSAQAHTFGTSLVPPNSLLGSFSMLVQHGGSSTGTQEMYTGCKINSMTFKGTLDAPLEVSLDIIGQNVQVYTPATTSYPITYDTDTVQPPQYGTVTLGGSSVADVQDVDITISNNLESIYGLGSRLVQQVMPKTFVMDVRTTLIFNNIAALNRFNKFLGDAASPFTVAAQGDATIEAFNLTYSNLGATTYLRKINFDLTNVKWDTVNIPSRVGDITKMELSGHLYGLTETGIVTTDNNSVTYPA